MLSEPEQDVYANVLRKERDAETLSTRLIGNVAEYERAEIAHSQRSKFVYSEQDVASDGWKMMLGDSCERLAEIEDDSIGLSVYSPPFESLVHLFTVRP